MHPHTRRVLALGIVLTILGMITRALLSRGPDFGLSFQRQVRSPLPIEALRKDLSLREGWSEWHFNVRRIETSAAAAPESLRLYLEPPKKEWKRFELDIALQQHDPDHVAVQVVHESKGRLEKLLSDIGWSIELLPDPQGQGTLIRGEAHARTAGPKARMLGRVVPRIVMNQVFYPDLEALAHPEKRRGKTGEKHDGRLLPF